uniref:Uncharacterized protein n=1 Tax=Opuntia streptacantha TaxID=393608 RepID=A0A7C9ACK9_OPUST
MASPQDTTPCCSTSWEWHLFYEVHGFLHHSSSAVKIHHTGIVFHGWVNMLLLDHQIKIFFTFFDQSSMSTGRDDTNHCNTIHCYSFPSHLLKYLESLMPITMLCKSAYH